MAIAPIVYDISVPTLGVHTFSTCEDMKKTVALRAARAHLQHSYIGLSQTAASFPAGQLYIEGGRSGGGGTQSVHWYTRARPVQGMCKCMSYDYKLNNIIL